MLAFCPSENSLRLRIRLEIPCFEWEEAVLCGALQFFLGRMRSGFLPQCKDTQSGVSGNCKLRVGVN